MSYFPASAIAVLAGESRWCVEEADALDVLLTLPFAGIGALVTDPPYGINHASGMEGPHRDRPILGDESLMTRDTALALWGDRPALVFGSWKVSAPIGSHTCLVWDKGPASGMGDLSIPWKPSWEAIFVKGRGFAGARDEGVMRGHTVVTWASKGREHPNEKPVSLMRALVAKCPPGVILDPFCGSASTGVAALREGRSVVLIEKDPRWAELARQRMAAESAHSTLAATRAGQEALFTAK